MPNELGQLPEALFSAYVLDNYIKDFYLSIGVDPVAPESMGADTRATIVSLASLRLSLNTVASQVGNQLAYLNTKIDVKRPSKKRR